MEIKVINNSKNKLPEYKTPWSSGMDLRANESLVLRPGEIKLVSTGIQVYIGDPSYELQIRSRSGLSCQGIIVVNSPSTIDADYQGELKIILGNFGNKDFEVRVGDRIAQAVLVKVEKFTWKPVDKFEKITERAENGFGHTGLK